MAYRAASRALRAAHSLKEAKALWSEVEERLSAAAMAVGPSSPFDVASFARKLQAALPRHIDKVIQVMDMKALADWGLARTFREKGSIAAKAIAELKQGLCELTKLKIVSTMPPDRSCERTIAVAVSKWEARVAQLGRHLDTEKREEQGRRETAALRPLADAILAILQKHRGQPFTYDELMSQVPQGSLALSRGESARRGAVSRAVRLLRREGHPIPPYRYVLPE